ncbi:enhancer of polycomb homolog 1 [Tribolium castaneum]|uniref:Enhancer of polycomb-like protein n=1 Tax=Tribolium castaneum TaxID=7070 RepID=D6WQ80_TRICA|nr:PREDICTED: enhancer of polycomb homolog 1 [Tribolium castaneum]EFA06113.2 Enhancer of polycomb homolog 2-like Protein [Tribolium castaneum]|eukprot:XP_008195757.1 PREDICTED: enhancer of polycomb homolog 1 [Tribolium castaneum]
MSKLSFRARALDASKPMPIYMAEELPDLPDYSAINRAVPQMPSGMEKEEECEHHLQRAICAGLIIPTPEVSDMPDKEFYDKVYPANYKQPRQLIHMQPFTMEQDIPDYDMDSEDERWLQSQAQRLDLTPLKFEEMMDRLEKSSGQTVVNLNEAKALLKEDDDLIIAVFDYWLNKRLKTQHPLILTVKTEQRAGAAPNNPYLAFRRRTEKMQTRKNRKNDETSYEKMLKLRRDLHRAVTLLELVKKREKMKREHVYLTVETFEKRFHARDFSGAIYAEAAAIKTTRPAFTPIFHNHYPNQSWSNKAILKDEVIPRKEKRQYKKRKHKSLGHTRSGGIGAAGLDGLGALSSDEDTMPQLSPEPEELEDEGQFAFRRNKLCSYHMPLPTEGNWPWCSKEENGLADKRFRFTLTSLSNPRRCIGFARRRIGRGGRVILDRIGTDHDDFWRTLDFTIVEPNAKKEEQQNETNLSSDGVVKMDASFVNNNTNVNNNLRTDIKSEYGYVSNSFSRTNVNDVGGESESGGQIDVKKEVEEDGGPQPETFAHSKSDEDEMVEILRSVRRDWLHFRPKTPPPDEESPCSLLPFSESYFVPGANMSFSIEVQSLETPSTLLDTSAFLTDPFTFDNLDSIEDVPVTDTRQSSDKIVQTGINLNVNVGLNTLTPSVNDNSSSVFSNSNANLTDSIKLEDATSSSTSDENDERTIGCSRFYVSDLGVTKKNQTSKTQTVTSTLTSPKFNSVNAVSEGWSRSTATEGPLTNTNGLLSQFGLDGRTKNNKISYAYSGGVYQTVPPINASSGTLSLHTSAHTLTLNSHSANILEIPITDDTEPVSNKLVNSQCTEPGTATTNNKTKTIVRKNNLVMEVT